MRDHVLFLMFFITMAPVVISQTVETFGEDMVVMHHSKVAKGYNTSEITRSGATNCMNCATNIGVETDKVTGNTTSGFKKTLIVSKDGGNTGFGIFVLRSYKGVLVFQIQVTGAGKCIATTDKMQVLFRDGTRMELSNDADTNCEAIYTQYFGESFGKIKALERLRTKPIETLRIWTSKGFIEEDLSPIQSLQLQQTVNCLIED